MTKVRVWLTQNRNMGSEFKKWLTRTVANRLIKIQTKILEEHNMHPFQLAGKKKVWLPSPPSRIVMAQRDFLIEVFGEDAFDDEDPNPEYEGVASAVTAQIWSTSGKAYKVSINNRQTEEAKVNEGWNCEFYFLFQLF